MSTKDESSRIITIDMPKAMHTRLKAHADALGKSMQEVILDAIEATETCRSCAHVPNKKTREAIRAAEKGRGLVEVKNIEDLLKKLGI